MGPPKVKEGGSKKSKRSWRKNIDITEVEDALEEERFNERIGGGVDKKKDEELFMFDNEGVDKESEEKVEKKRCNTCLQCKPEQNESKEVQDFFFARGITRC